MIRTVCIIAALLWVCVLFQTSTHAQNRATCDNPDCAVECHPRVKRYVLPYDAASPVYQELRRRREAGEILTWRFPYGGYDNYGQCQDPEFEWLVWVFFPKNKKEIEKK